MVELCEINPVESDRNMVEWGRVKYNQVEPRL